MPELFLHKKLVAFHLNKGMLGFVGEIQSKLSTVNPSLPRRVFQEMCQEKIKEPSNLRGYKILLYEES